MIKINTFGNVKTKYMRDIAYDIDSNGEPLYRKEEYNGVVLAMTDGTEYNHVIDRIDNGTAYFKHNDIEFYFDTHSKHTGKPVFEVLTDKKAPKAKKEAE